MYIETTARRAFSVLERGWIHSGKGRLKDCKVEFGWYRIGMLQHAVLFIADVIDNDSWRLEIDGKEVSKEVYRQGADLAEVLRCYQLVAGRSVGFIHMAT